MRAIMFDQPGDESVLRIGEVPPPELHPSEIRIRVRATSVNRADLLQRQGLYPPPRGASSILGLDCAGEVKEVGATAGSDWRPGDRVMALLPGGGYAEEVVVDAGSTMRVPANLSDAEAGALPEVFLTAFLNVFQLGEPPPGGRVLIHGGGSGVGTAATTLCREAGLTAIVTAGSGKKCRRALEHGAAVAVDYRAGDFAEQVRTATGGAGVNVVLDCVGARYLAANLSCLAAGGRLVIIGLTGGARAELDLAPLLSRRLHVIGSTLRSRSVEQKAALVAAFLGRFGGALEAGRIRPVVDRVLPLEQAAEAHRVMQAGDHFGKIALRVS